MMLADDDNSKIPVHGDDIPGADKFDGFGNAGHTGKAILPGDDSAVNEHAPSPFHDPGGKGHDKGHVGVDRITDQDFPCLEGHEVRGVPNHPRRPTGKPRSGGLAHELPRVDTPLLFFPLPRFRSLRHKIGIVQALDDVFNREMTRRLS